MRKKIAFISVILLTLACQIVPTPPPLRPTPRPSPTPPPAFPATTPTTALAGPVITSDATRAPGDLLEFPYRAGQPYAPVEIPGWQPAPLPAAAALALPAALEDLANPAVIAGLTLRQQEQLLRDGFVVLPSQEAGFEALRRRVTVCYGQPYFLTTDAAFYALDRALDQLIPTLEQEELHRRMIAVLQATLGETLRYLDQGGALAVEVHLAAAYLGVGLRLLDPQAAIDPRLLAAVEPQVDQILAGRGLEASTLIPGFQDDFGLYRPAGHYAANPALQAYFRGMTWLSRALLSLDDPAAGKAALILTLALRRAHIDPARLPAADGETQMADAEWARLRATLTFLHGPGPDYGPAEYARLMDQVYTPGATVVGLADNRLWERFRLFARALPPEQVGGVTANTFSAGAPVAGWRWMAHGDRLDDAILTNLDRVRVADPPQLPSPLDVMAALGSATAVEALVAAQPLNPGDYTTRTTALHEWIARQSQASWTGAASDIRLHAFRSQLVDKGAAFTTPLRAPGWKYKDLNSALGGWVHLRRDPGAPPAGVPSTPPEPPAGPLSTPAPGYVEPNPEVFYRLAVLASTLAEGLSQRGMVGVFSPTGAASDLNVRVQALADLGDRLRRLGDIAAAELAGVAPVAADWAVIAAGLEAAGPLAVVAESCDQPADAFHPVVELVELRGPGGLVQVAATGGVNRIYVLARIGEALLVTQGGVFSYYEFPESLYGPLEPAVWRRLLANEPVEPPGWTAALFWPEGNPVDVLAFHIGAAYRVTPAGGRLNLREEPGRSAAVVQQLAPGAGFTIIDGPAAAQGFTWWQVRVEVSDGPPVEGWVVENQTWYARRPNK